MATQELAGFLAAIILAQKTGLIDKIINAKNGEVPIDPGLIKPPPPEPKKPFIDSGVCLTKREYVDQWGPVTEKEYREYIQMSGCRIQSI